MANKCPGEILLASSNRHKITEFQALFSRLMPQIKFSSLRDYPLLATEVAETGSSYQQNAYLKAAAYAQLTSFPVLADDSGVEVAALPHLLGIHSHRFAPGSDQDRVQALLTKLRGETNRALTYVCVLCYLAPGEKAVYFRGELLGSAALEARGSGNFGYDSVMVPQGEKRTLAQLSMTAKNQISHRFLAVKQLQAYLVG